MASLDLLQALPSTGVMLGLLSPCALLPLSSQREQLSEEENLFCPSGVSAGSKRWVSEVQHLEHLIFPSMKKAASKASDADDVGIGTN